MSKRGSLSAKWPSPGLKLSTHLANKVVYIYKSLTNFVGYAAVALLMDIKKSNEKVQEGHTSKERTRGVHHRPLSPYADKPLLSVTHGQCDARPTVTFPA